MEIIETDDVWHHKKNQSYPCILFCFNLGDKRFRVSKQDGIDFDYMPTSEDVLKIVETFLKYKDSNLKQKILDLINSE